VGTPSSKSLTKAAEKLAVSSSISGKCLLFEEFFLALGVLLGILLERLILD
jgi:hypothetical protein